MSNARGGADPHEGRRARPWTLLGAAGLVATEGVAMVVYAVLEMVHVDADRVGIAVTTALFFAALGAGLLACARGLGQVRSWARSPVVVAQAIALLTAWSFRGGTTTSVAVVLAVVGLAGLGLLFSPASTAALASDPT